MENKETNIVPVLKKSKWRKRLAISSICVFLIFIIYVFICGMSYSEGSRTGVVVKISQKGYIFKTYEGEMNLGGIASGDGTLMPTRFWVFSVQKNNDSLFDAITNQQGKQVRLHYKEVIKVFFWQAETKYFVTKVELLK